MATITLEYDKRNAFAVSMIDTLRKSGVFRLTTPAAKSKASAKAEMCSAEISLKEIEEGNVFRAKSVDDLFKQCGIDV